MQRLPSDRRVFCRHPTVYLIPAQRVTDVCEMHPELMCPPGVRHSKHKRVPFRCRQYPVGGQGVLALGSVGVTAGGSGTHGDSGRRQADGYLNAVQTSVGGQLTFQHGEVAFGHAPPDQATAEESGDRLRFGDHDHPAGVSVQPSHGTENKRNPGACVAVCERVGKGVGEVSVGGMRRHSRRLVENNQQVVLVENIEGCLRRQDGTGRGIRRVIHSELQQIPGVQNIADGHADTVDRDAVLPRLKARQCACRERKRILQIRAEQAPLVGRRDRNGHSKSS